MYLVAWTLFYLCYAAVSLFALYMTYREHRVNGHKNLLMSVLSYALCIAWPIAFGAVLVFATLHPARFTPAEQS